MTEQWKKLKETITELQENDDVGTQQEVSEFLADLMDLLEEQMENQDECIPVSKRAIVAMLEKFAEISFKKRNQKLIDAAQIIKDFCQYHSCDNCPFSSIDWKTVYKCELQDRTPYYWCLPAEDGDCDGNDQRRID